MEQAKADACPDAITAASASPNNALIRRPSLPSAMQKASEQPSDTDHRT